MLRVGLIILLTILGTGSVRSAETKRAGHLEWEKTVEAAKKEGQVNPDPTLIGPRNYRQQASDGP